MSETRSLSRRLPGATVLQIVPALTDEPAARAAVNVASVTVDVSRARVDCNVSLHVTTDGPLTVNLAGCGRTVSF